MTRRVGARELKNRLGSYLALVRDGTTIYVTDRGRPVAELRPVSQAGTDEETELQTLVASGLVAPRRSASLSEPAPRIRLRGVPLSQTIREDRDAGP
jgi:prevent-host-death family protein